jgi:hypothetical protein
MMVQWGRRDEKTQDPAFGLGFVHDGGGGGGAGFGLNKAGVVRKAAVQRFPSGNNHSHRSGRKRPLQEHEE